MLLLDRLPALQSADGSEPGRGRRATGARGNWIVSARVCRTEQPRRVLPLSIRAAWGGIERCGIDNRTVAVDDDGYLILNDGRESGSTIDAEHPVHSLVVLFRPGFADEVLGGMLTSLDHMLERGVEPACRPFEFAENLRPHDRCVTPVLRYIGYHVDHGVDDEDWYEEQLSFLLERMLQSHRRVLQAIQRLPPLRGATRREIWRRIGLATDFIHASFDRDLTVDDLAAAAHISKFHFVRLFRAVHGTTPYAFLQARRARVAWRLLNTSDAGLDQIAARAGFENRVTLFRHLQRVAGGSGRALRRARLAADNGERAGEEKQWL